MKEICNKGVRIAFLSFLISFLFISTTSAQEIINFGENKVFTQLNYHINSTGNEAYAICHPSSCEQCAKQALVGLSFLVVPPPGQSLDNLGQEPVQVSITYTHFLSTAYNGSFGSSDAEFNPPYPIILLDQRGGQPWYEILVNTTAAIGPVTVTKTYTTPLDLFRSPLYFLVQSQAGCSGNFGEAWVKVDSIEVKFNQKPNIGLLEAKMLSDNQLGISANVKFPKADQSQRFVRLNAVINGKQIEKTIDVTQFTYEDQESALLISDPFNPLVLNLEELGVPRFEENQKFDLTAEAFNDTRGSDMATLKNVEVLLPVVLVHGILGEWGMLSWNSCLCPDSMAVLKNYLLDNGYVQPPAAHPTLYYDFFFSGVSCVTNAQDLITKVKENVLKNTYANKVNIVAHSMGGLISRYAIAAGLPVNTLVMIATPNQGSTEAFTKIVSANPIIKWMYGDAGMQLLPTYDFMYKENHALYSSLQKQFQNNFLLTLNSWIPDVSTNYISIYNSAIDTLDKVIVIKHGTSMKYEPFMFSPGDGTVLSSSAILQGAENYDIQEVSQCTQDYGSHCCLPQSQCIMDGVLYFMKNR
jgi:pimeloyl-ACP methyl ester carboxylesterase